MISKVIMMFLEILKTRDLYKSLYKKTPTSYEAIIDMVNWYVNAKKVNQAKRR